MPKTTFFDRPPTKGCQHPVTLCHITAEKVPIRRLFPRHIMHNHSAILNSHKVKKKVAKVQSTVAFINHI